MFNVERNEGEEKSDKNTHDISFTAVIYEIQNTRFYGNSISDRKLFKTQSIFDRFIANLWVCEQESNTLICRIWENKQRMRNTTQNEKKKKNHINFLEKIQIISNISMVN